MRYVITLIIGCAVGYSLGFQDARQNDKNIVARLVDQVGGQTRDKVQSDVDAQMSRVESDSAARKH
jgi:hypothetical protein